MGVYCFRVMVHCQGDDPLTMNRKKISVSVSIIMILTLSILVASNYPPESTVKELEQPAKFVLASWDYPDEYGQGVEGFWIYENSTSEWVKVYEVYYDNISSIFEWNASVGIKLRCWALLNATLTGSSTKDIGKNYLRHNVIVTMLGTTVFSQQNFTFASALDEAYGIYLYAYDVVLNFLPLAGEIYTVIVTYEVWW